VHWHSFHELEFLYQFERQFEPLHSIRFRLTVLLVRLPELALQSSLRQVSLEVFLNFSIQRLLLGAGPLEWVPRRPTGSDSVRP